MAMATPAPGFWQRDAVTLQPNLVAVGRGPKGVFNLTPEALSIMSATTAKLSGMVWVDMIVAVTLRRWCLALALLIKLRRTAA